MNLDKFLQLLILEKKKRNQFVKLICATAVNIFTR